MIKTYLSYGIVALSIIAITVLIALHDVPSNVINALVGMLAGSTGTHLFNTFFGGNTQVQVHLPSNSTSSAPTSGSIS